MDSWSALLIVAKIGLYLSCAHCIAAPFISGLLPQDSPHIRLQIGKLSLGAAVLGISLSALYFALRVGQISDHGWLGMLDPDISNLLLNSTFGASSLILVGSFVLFVCWSLLLIARPERPFYFGNILYISGLICLGVSVGLVGHTAEKAFFVRAFLVFHVLGVLMWSGSLYPLFRLCRRENLHFLQSYLLRFSNYTTVFYPVALLLGAIVTYFLLEDWQQLISSLYGQTLLAKIAVVFLILILATVNKLRLTQQITSDDGTALAYLKTAIGIEAGLMLGVLVLIAYITHAGTLH